MSASTAPSPAHRRGLVIGCGGTLGFPWSVAALDELQRQLCWDVRDADVIVGSSAGSEIAAALGAGHTPADLLAALRGSPQAEDVLSRHLASHPGHLPPWPAASFPGWGLIATGIRERSAYSGLAGLLPRGRGDSGWLRSFGRALAPEATWATHPAVWIVAADIGTGRRVAFGSPGAPTTDLGTAIAASWAIPGWFPPVEVAGRRYVDGGTVSTASADLVVPLHLDEVAVVAPMTTEGGAPARGIERIERLLRSQMTRRLNREIALLEDVGTRVIRIEPGPLELAAMGPNFMNLSRRADTLAQAREELPTRVATAIQRAHTTGSHS